MKLRLSESANFVKKIKTHFFPDYDYKTRYLIINKFSIITLIATDSESFIINILRHNRSNCCALKLFKIFSLFIGIQA